MKKRGQKAMTNKELSSYLEAIRIIVEISNDKSDIVKALEQLQSKLK
jgi:hypothetical protein